MEIVKLRVKTENGETETNSLSLVAGLGIEGDKKARGGDRQLCLADEDAFNRYRENGRGMCIHRFMPNITTRGIDYSSVKPGTAFDLGDVTIEISDCKKKCFDECEFVKSGRVCEIKKYCAFAKIISSGTITV